MANENTELLKVKIQSNQIISSTSYILRFKKVFPFQAGQVIGITTSPVIPPRLYSISNAEDDENIEILYKFIKEGKLTPQLKSLNQGDWLYITPPFGKFIACKDPSYFVATGTGIAPFLSMMRSGYTNCKKLLHGSRTIEDLYETDYLRSLLGDNYVQCYTGTEKHVGFNGRVTAYINNTFNLDPKDKYYLCGSAEMVVETREVLISKGIPFQNILSEIYF
jgi:ferredoxin--NADP+ reductase